MDDVIQGRACTGFDVSRDGERFRLQLLDGSGRQLSLELPITGLETLIKLLPEIQQVALPRERGNQALRVIRRAQAWSLERDMADESLLLVLVTVDGFEWCFQLDDAEIFRMANTLRDERAVTLAAPDTCQ
jgi:hypothetical protein